MLGVYPYITAQISIQILQPVIPRLEELMREGGEAGRQRINQITRIVTVPLAMLQALGQGALLSNAGALNNFGLFNAHTFLPTLQFLITTAAGTMFLIWLGELITENGIGNGVSLIIFAGIIARLPGLVGPQLQSNALLVVILAIVSALIIAAIVFVQQAQRRIPVQYAKRVVGRRVMQGQSTFIPIPVNSAGMIPLIFAISIVTAPYIISSYFVFWTTGIWNGIANFFYTTFQYNSPSPIYWITLLPAGGWLHLLLHGDPVPAAAAAGDAAEERRLHPRLPAGRADGVVSDTRGEPRHQSPARSSWARRPAAPLRQAVLNTPLNLTISATALLIIVGVVIDTMRQLEAQLMMRNYQSFIK